jgi:hypothetical protein
MKKNSTNIITRKLTDEELSHYNKVIPKKEKVQVTISAHIIPNQYVLNNLKDIAQNSCLSNLSEEMEEYEQSVLKESEREMLMLLDFTVSDNFTESLTFDQLSKCTFDRAHEFINKMTLPKRIHILHELDKHLLHVYETTKGYNDQGFGKSLSPNIFYSLMGKIKHLEILQSWLYGID